MALQFKVSKEDYEKLPDALKSLYKEDGEEFVLDLEGTPEPEKDEALELKRALAREREDKKALKEKVDEFEKLQKEKEFLDAKGKKDLDKLTKYFEEQTELQKKQYEDQLEKSKTALRKQMVDNNVMSVATELAGSKAALIAPHIRSRIDVNFENEIPELVILDELGNNSHQTLDHLKKSFLADPLFKDIMVATKASGSGASGQTGKDNGVDLNGLSGKKWDEIPAEELSKIREADPETYNTLLSTKGR